MEFEAVVNRIVYKNPDNGYGILAIELTGEGGGEETCVGTFPDVEAGDYLKLEGEWTNHPTYGPQIKASSYAVVAPADAVAIENYLASGAIKGIGKVMASRIVKEFGVKALEIVESDPKQLSKVKGISLKKATEIVMLAAEKKNMRDAMMFLQQYGISLRLSVKIYNRYQLDLYNIIKTDPYRLAIDIEGVGFKTADEIAMKAGIPADSEIRLRAIIIYTLQTLGANGHTYMPENELVGQISSQYGWSGEEIKKHLTDLVFEGRAVAVPKGDTRQVYESRLFYAEKNVASKLLALRFEDGIRAGSIDRYLADFEREMKMQLGEQQKNAVAVAALHGVSVITGGPGTGKTTTVNALIYCMERMNMKVSLAAPTGRAAKRMQEATGHEAQTLHRLLEVSAAGEERSITFSRNEDHPLEADAVIVDETSMVDIFLINALLKAIVRGVRLVLVGDKDQLPSVGPGRVLKDIIESGKFPVVLLETIFRQDETSDIIVNAHKINRGERVWPRTDSRDFLFVKREEAERVQAAVATLVREKLPPYVNASWRDIQVLTPMRKGALGVENLNTYLQRVLNPEQAGKEQKETDRCIFREGDKVMQIRNNYEKEWEVCDSAGLTLKSGIGVFNGDTGQLKSINQYAREVSVEFDEGRVAVYGFEELDDLELAYAITIHKSQGSEYPAVVLPLLAGSSLLMTRNLLYTAVTRAKSCVVVVGRVQTFHDMIDNHMENKRYSGLCDRIGEIASGVRPI